MKLLCWNVNGLRACLGKGFIEWLHVSQADIACLQETKAHPSQLPPEAKVIPGFHIHFSAAQRAGYSGTGTYSRRAPKRVSEGFGLAPEFDCEGRILQTEYDGFTLLNIYFPNGTSGEDRLAYKLRFYDATLTYCESLRAQGHKLVICGDYNTAHHEIDIARPKENEGTSGFLPIERAWLDKWVAHGYVDTYRRLHPDARDMYTWWSFRAGARARNVGWRIDYFFVTEDLWPQVRGADIYPEIQGSDHCPLSLDLDV